MTIFAPFFTFAVGGFWEVGIGGIGSQGHFKTFGRATFSLTALLFFRNAGKISRIIILTVLAGS